MEQTRSMELAEKERRDEMRADRWSFHMLGMPSPTEPKLHLHFSLFWGVCGGGERHRVSLSHAVLQTQFAAKYDFECSILLPPLPKCWNYRHVPLHSWMWCWEFSPGLHACWARTLSTKLHHGLVFPFSCVKRTFWAIQTSLELILSPGRPWTGDPPAPCT